MYARRVDRALSNQVPGPGTSSTSRGPSTSVPWATSAATTGFPPARVRSSTGGFSDRAGGVHRRVIWAGLGCPRMIRRSRSKIRHASLLGLGLAAAFTGTACDNQTGRNGASSTSAPSSFTSTACGTDSGRGCAPSGDRVDLSRPTFSNSTQITNPLFPISRLRSAVLLGHVDQGMRFRTETTLLPGTRTIAWAGQHVRVRISQYVAYRDGRLDEVALDRYAQADDGSVWYLGEDVYDYRNGAIAVTEGTWLAGREGPAAMIMPAQPKVGDVYRTENVPGIVFEEVKIKSVGRSLDGPSGPIRGGLVADELHGDGTYDHKIFAPGYGEFRTTGGGDLEALALAVPKDALHGPPPAELDALAISTRAILESARIEEWATVTATLERMTAAWAKLQTGAPPPLIAARMTDALSALTSAVKERRPGRIAQAAIDVGQSALDLELRQRDPSAIDAARFELWTQQLRVDAASGDLSGVTGDVAVLEWIRDRFADSLDRSGRRDLNAGLHDLRAAADAKNLPAAADHAARLASLLRDVAQP